MATQRLVNTNFWRDTYVIDLDPTQKLLFLYFLTNPATSLAGIYEISLRQVAFDTGIDRDMVEKIMGKFIDDGKMFYKDGWLILRNFVKHQRLNPSVQRGIVRAVSELPVWLQEMFKEHSAFYDQISIDLAAQPEVQQTQLVPDTPQSGNSLPTDTPQTPTPNLTKPNLTKPNSTEPGKPGGSTKLTGTHARQYARAVRADEALAEKETTAHDRGKGSGESGYDIAKRKVAEIKQRTTK